MAATEPQGSREGVMNRKGAALDGTLLVGIPVQKEASAFLYISQISR
jgi:hypothetical protein